MVFLNRIRITGWLIVPRGILTPNSNIVQISKAVPVCGLEMRHDILSRPLGSLRRTFSEPLSYTETDQHG
jgi:hypothetical protein